jgi:hypothetical protein
MSRNARCPRQKFLSDRGVTSAGRRAARPCWSSGYFSTCPSTPQCVSEHPPHLLPAPLAAPLPPFRSCVSVTCRAFRRARRLNQTVLAFVSPLSNSSPAIAAKPLLRAYNIGAERPSHPDRVDPHRAVHRAAAGIGNGPHRVVGPQQRTRALALHPTPRLLARPHAGVSGRRLAVTSWCERAALGNTPSGKCLIGVSNM